MRKSETDKIFAAGKGFVLDGSDTLREVVIFQRTSGRIGNDRSHLFVEQNSLEGLVSLVVWAHLDPVKVRTLHKCPFSDGRDAVWEEEVR